MCKEGRERGKMIFKGADSCRLQLEVQAFFLLAVSIITKMVAVYVCSMATPLLFSYLGNIQEIEGMHSA